MGMCLFLGEPGEPHLGRCHVCCFQQGPPGNAMRCLRQSDRVASGELRPPLLASKTTPRSPSCCFLSVTVAGCWGKVHGNKQQLAIQEANKQTTKTTTSKREQTNQVNQPNKQPTGRPTDRKTRTQAGRQAGKQASKRAGSQASNQPTDHAGRQAGRQASKQARGQAVKQASKQASKQQTNQAIETHVSCLLVGIFEGPRPPCPGRSRGAHKFHSMASAN